MRHGVELMCCQQDADTILLEALDHPVGLFARLAVHIGRRFIQQQHPWFQYAGTCKGHPLTLATGQFTGIAHLQMTDAGPVQCLRDLAGNFLDREFPVTQAIGNVVGDAAIKQVRVLVQVDNVGTHPLACAPPGYDLAFKGHRHAVRCLKTSDDPHQG